jgi:hypothetical protein
MKPKTAVIKFPMTLKRFLVITLPALYNKPQRRVAAWREFSKSEDARHTHSIGRYTISDFAKWLKDGNTIPDDGAYVTLARSFLTWYSDWRNEKTRRERKAAAFKRHKKIGARPNRVALKKCLLT